MSRLHLQPRSLTVRADALPQQVHVYSLVMEKGARDRYQEDHLSSRLLLQAIADACEVSRRVVLPIGLTPSRTHTSILDTVNYR